MRVVLINARDAAGDERPVNQRKPGYYGLCEGRVAIIARRCCTTDIYSFCGVGLAIYWVTDVSISAI